MRQSCLYGQLQAFEDDEQHQVLLLLDKHVQRKLHRYLPTGRRATSPKAPNQTAPRHDLVMVVGIVRMLFHISLVMDLLLVVRTVEIQQEVRGCGIYAATSSFDRLQFG